MLSVFRILVCLLVLMQSSLSFADEFRVLFLGLSNAGKTTLINQFYTCLTSKDKKHGGFIAPVNTKDTQTGENIRYPDEADLDEDFLDRRDLLDPSKRLDPIKTYRVLKAHTAQGDYRNSDTSDIVGYMVREPLTGHTIELIDTPGFFDSDGVYFDQKLRQALLEFLQQEKINTVIVVLNGQSARSDPKVDDMYETILSLIPATDIREKCFFAVNHADDPEVIDREKERIRNILRKRYCYVPGYFMIDAINPTELLARHKKAFLDDEQSLHYQICCNKTKAWLEKIKGNTEFLDIARVIDLDKQVQACHQWFKQKLEAESKLQELQPQYAEQQDISNHRQAVIEDMRGHEKIEKKSQSAPTSLTKEMWTGNKVTVQANIFHDSIACEVAGDFCFEINRADPKLTAPRYLAIARVLQGLKKIKSTPREEYECQCGQAFEPFCIQSKIVTQEDQYETKTYQNPGEITTDEQELTSVKNLIDRATKRTITNEKNLRDSKAEIDTHTTTAKDAALQMKRIWQVVSEDKLCDNVDCFIHLIQEQHRLGQHYYNAPTDNTDALRHILTDF